MPLVFRTPKDCTVPTDIVGVGVLPAGGVGGLPVAVAAQRGLAPLIVHDPATGDPVLQDDGSYTVLEAGALTAAARKWAEGAGVEVVNLKEADADLQALLADAGLPVDQYPDARTKAEQEYVRAFPDGEVVLNADPEANAAGLVDPEANPDTATHTGGDE